MPSLHLAYEIFGLGAGDGPVDWAQLGGTYKGYRLESYEAKGGVLVLSRDGNRLKLALTDGHVQPALPRADALALFRALVGKLQATTKSMLTYEPLPPDQ